MDEECSEKSKGADHVFVSPTQEHRGSPFILVVQTIGNTDKYTPETVIQQVYKGSGEEHPRTRTYREGMKYRSSLPNKLKCPKLFEVDDQINHVL